MTVVLIVVRVFPAVPALVQSFGTTRWNIIELDGIDVKNVVVAMIVLMYALWKLSSGPILLRHR